jgi:hypothetical protein
MGSGRQVGLKGRPLCAGVSVAVIVRSYATEVDVYVDDPAEPICVGTSPIDSAHGRQRRSNSANLLLDPAAANLEFGCIACSILRACASELSF